MSELDDQIDALCDRRDRQKSIGGDTGDTTYFLGGGCEPDWKFLCWGDSVLSCIGHAKE